MTNKKILVTGATGTVGKALIERLKPGMAPFVAAVRDTEKAKALLGLSSQQVVAFNFADTSTFEAAAEGVDVVFLLGPPLVLHLDKLLTPFIDFLKSKGINRVVYSSALNAEKMGSDLNFHTNIENKLKQDGLDYTILKPSFFAQNFKNYEWDNIQKHHITYMPAGTGKAAFADVNDIAAMAAASLTGEGHIDKTYSVTGPEALSYEEAAKLLTEVTGQTIVYPNPTPEQYAETLKQAGAPDFIAPYMISVYSVIAKQEADQVTDDVQKVTGKKPSHLKEVLERDFA